MSVGLRVSNRTKNADSTDPRDLSFSSEYYMHTIGKTEYRVSSGSEQKVSHTFGYIPVLFSYTEDPNNAGDFRWAGFSQLTGADKTRIRIAYAANQKIRYYALHQPI